MPAPDAAGIARISTEPGQLDRLCLVARHEGRHIGAIASVDRQQQTGPVQLTLSPERTIVGEAVCPEIPRELLEKGVIVYVSAGGKTALECSFAEPRFQVPLPAGKYSLEVYGLGTLSTFREVVVSPARDEQRLGPVHLKATGWALLIGKPVPEIPEVVAWKNSEPLKLADLRGKVVLLDFGVTGADPASMGCAISSNSMTNTTIEVWKSLGCMSIKAKLKTKRSTLSLDSTPGSRGRATSCGTAATFRFPSRAGRWAAHAVR